MRVLENVVLGPMTSLEIGGRAKRLVEAASEGEILEAVRDADARGERVLVLGGGSNVVIADEGFDGLVVRIASRGVKVAREGERARVEVEAGEPWDALVARAVGERWSGVECLAGIPGLVGATPIQNVGAYGQEVSQTIARVVAYDRSAKTMVDLAASACAFAYRASMFKGSERYVVVRVAFDFAVNDDSAPIAYAELAKALGVKEGERAPLERVRRTVISLRRGKGMVLDPADPDSVSAGSFFVNPVLDAAALAVLERRVAERAPGASLPKFPAENGKTKVSAAWLIERAGFAKGFGEGRVGISSKHALALVNRGGATARELLDLARAIQRGVNEAFGVEIVPEPVIVAG